MSYFTTVEWALFIIDCAIVINDAVELARIIF